MHQQHGINALEAVQRFAIRFLDLHVETTQDFPVLLPCSSRLVQERSWSPSSPLRCNYDVHNLAHLSFPPSVNIAYDGTRSNHPYKFRDIVAHGNAYNFSFFPRPTAAQLLCSKGTLYPPPPGGVLPYVTSTGTCGPIGYGFQGVLSWTGYLFHHFCLKQGIATRPNGLNRISLDVWLLVFWRTKDISMTSSRLGLPMH